MAFEPINPDVEARFWRRFRIVQRGYLPVTIAMFGCLGGECVLLHLLGVSILVGVLILFCSFALFGLSLSAFYLWLLRCPQCGLPAANNIIPSIRQSFGGVAKQCLKCGYPYEERKGLRLERTLSRRRDHGPA